MIGATLSDDKVLDLLDAGGKGKVNRAEDMTLDSEAAIEILPAEL